MYLFHRTLQPPTAIRHSATGHFTSSKGDFEEIAIVKGQSFIEILQIQVGPNRVKLTPVSSINTFGQVRSLGTLRVPGTALDYLAVSSDSGALVLCKYVDTELKRVWSHVYGKSGCRRTVPGHYLNVEKEGRCLLLSAVEQGRLVYCVERALKTDEQEEQEEIKIRSPLDASKADQVTVCTAYLITSASENPKFVAVEGEYTDTDEKWWLAVYEIELGLNHVVRSAQFAIQFPCHYVVPLPSGDFLACQDTPTSMITRYRHVGVNKIEEVERMEGVGFVCSHSNFTFDGQEYIYLLNTQGTLYLVTLSDQMTIQFYYDLNNSYSNICVLKGGLLFITGDYCNHQLYQILSVNHDGLKLQLLDELVNHGPLLASQLLESKTNELQLLTTSGSLLNVVKPGLAVTEIASTQLPNSSQSIFSCLLSSEQQLAISFPDRTMFLRVEEAVEEIAQDDISIPYIRTMPTMVLERMEGGLIVQVTFEGWYAYEEGTLALEWKTAGQPIICAAANSRQLVIALADRSLVYFELTAAGDHKQKLRQISTVTLPNTPACMSLGPVPEHRLRSRFLVVGGSGTEKIIRLLSCDPADRMEQLALQAAASPPTALAFTQTHGDLHLNIGLSSGVYVRLTVDPQNGSLSDVHSRFLGSGPISFSSISGDTLIASTRISQTWYIQNGAANQLNCKLQAAASFSTSNIPNAITGIFEDQLKIITIDDPDMPFNGFTTRFNLDGRIRKINQDTDYISCVSASNLVTVISKQTLSVHQQVTLEDENVHCAAVITFAAKKCLAIASSTGFEPRVGTCVESFIHVYSLPECTLIHSTPLQGLIPTAMTEFGGKLLIGLSDVLRLYDLGKKRLLRKAESKLPSPVTCLACQGLRIYVGTVNHSVLFYCLRVTDHQLKCFADDSTPLQITCLLVLDYETVAVADRLGNFSVLRMPPGLTDSLEKDPSGIALASRETLFAAPHKLERVCWYHLGDLVTGLSKSLLYYGKDRDSIIYSTISGSLGIFHPLTHRSTASLCQTIEREMRAIVDQSDTLPAHSLVGRHHLLWRSGAVASKGVIDGDLLSRFKKLGYKEQVRIGDSADCDSEEIVRKVNSILF